MKRFLYGFMVFLLGYFVISVTASYYLDHITYGGLILPLIKEMMWFITILYALYVYRHDVGGFLLTTKLQGYLLGGIALRGIVATLLLYASLGALDSIVLIKIVIGLKYGLYASIIFYTAGFIGYAGALNESELSHFIRFICQAICRFLVVGILWQCLKWIAPSLFYDILGYGAVGDYVAGQPHPIYYRTGAGGYPRFSGLMSGPNNLGYVLVAYASIVPMYLTQWRVKLLYYGTSLATLSRAAMLGIGTQLLATSYRSLRRHKRIVRVLIVAGGGVLVALSIIKGASSREHIVRSVDSVHQVIQSPWGLGLGSSGPGVHRGGSILPENFYLQLLLDYGTIPFIARCGYWFSIMKQCHSIIKSQFGLSTLLRAFLAGFVGLLIVGLFLHVFEDSVVNYLFFIPFGMLRGQGLRILAKSSHTVYNEIL